MTQDTLYFRLGEALREAGDCYSLNDILDGISAGHFQSFAVGDSWAVTQILDFPRRRVLEIFMAVGWLGDMFELEERVEQFARQEGCTLIRAYGRKGWNRFAKSRGWDNSHTVFTKEIG